MLYGAEACTINGRQQEIFKATEMELWKSSSRKSPMERISNIRIREIVNVQKDIIQEIGKGRLRQQGDIKVMYSEKYKEH